MEFEFNIKNFTFTDLFCLEHLLKQEAIKALRTSRRFSGNVGKIFHDDFRRYFDMYKKVERAKSALLS